MIGGGGEKLTLEGVARHADWWNIPNVNSETYARKLQALHAHCDRVGRNCSEIKKTYAGIIAIAPTDAQAKAMAAASPFADPKRAPGLIVGCPRTIHGLLTDFVEVGAEHFILRFIDFPRTDGARLFAKEVVPSFAR